MQLKVNEVQLPAPITFNYEELKQELMKKAEAYASMVYTDDQIREAKADRANLNRLKKALNDERLKREKEYMEPFATFKAQINEIIKIIDKPCAVIDRQVKEFEERQKEAKLEEILEYFNSKGFDDEITPDKILEEKWLNASTSMKSIREAIDGKADQIEKDLAVVRSLPKFAFEAEQVYKQSLDLAKAVSEAHRLSEMAERKAAWEAEQANRKEPVAKTVPVQATATPWESEEPARTWISFQALLSVEEAKALGHWMKANNITYKAI